MKEIYRTTSLEEAQVFCSLLREHAIEPLLDGEHSGPVALGLYTTAAPLIIHVPDEHEAAAKEVLDALIRERGGEVVFESSAELPVSTPEEDARFREQVRQGRASARQLWLWVGLIFLVPVPFLLVTALMAFWRGDSELGLRVLLSAVALGLPPLLIHFAARPARYKAST